MKIVRYYPRALTGDGGMTTAVRQWSRWVAEVGAEVTVVHDRGCRPPVDDLVRWVGIRHLARNGLVVPVGLATVLREADVLVLHSGWTVQNVVAAAAARRAGVPYILEPRGAYDPHIVGRKRALKHAWWLTLERRLVQNARAIHVFFDLERPHLDALGYRGPVVIAPNGVSIPDGVSWNGGSGGYVLWLGRFDPEHKGLDLLLEAVRLLPARERPHLRLCGPDWRGHKAGVVRAVEELGLSEWVTVGEAVYGTTKWQLLRQARAFVYPSRWEAFGNAIAEAASVGLPALATPYPLGRYLASGNAAVLAEATPAALTVGLRDVLSSRAAELACNAARLAGTELTWDRVARSWLHQVSAVV